MTITLHAPLVVPLEEVRLLAFECARRRIAKPADLPPIWGYTTRGGSREGLFLAAPHSAEARAEDEGAD